MEYSFHINDISNPKAKAFLEYIKTLDFVSVDSDFDLNEDQVAAIEEARKSLKEKGGTPHEVVMARMKDKFPNAFRS